MSRLATRRQHLAPRGRARPERAFTSPAPVRTQPRPHFPISPPPLSLAAPQQQRRSPPPSLPATGLSGRFSITAIPPPSPQHPIASPSARCSSSVSASAVQMLTGAPSPTPSSWPRRHSPPSAPLTSALGPPAFVGACPHVRLSRRGRHRCTADVPPRRAAMAAAVVTSVDDRAGQVVQTMRLDE